eukprot:10958344-Alexandrium_andersonii.AAC.1
MSASLVGSEMCIRDRRETRRRTRPSGALGADFEAASGPAQFKLRRPHAPVSYTHLTLPTICSV